MVKQYAVLAHGMSNKQVTIEGFLKLVLLDICTMQITCIHPALKKTL